MCALWVPISLILGTFFEAFSNKWPKGSRALPQSGNKIGKWTPRVPKYIQRVPTWSPKVTQIKNKNPKAALKCHQDTEMSNLEPPPCPPLALKLVLPPACE